LPKSSNFAKGELMVKLNKRAIRLISTPILKIESKLVVPRFGIKDLDSILENFDVTEISEVSPNLFLIRMPLDSDLNTAKEKIFNSGYVEDVDFNYTRSTL